MSTAGSLGGGASGDRAEMVSRSGDAIVYSTGGAETSVATLVDRTRDVLAAALARGEWVNRLVVDPELYHRLIEAKLREQRTGTAPTLLGLWIERDEDR